MQGDAHRKVTQAVGGGARGGSVSSGLPVGTSPSLVSHRVLRQNFLTLGPELVPDSDVTTSLQFKDIDQTVLLGGSGGHIHEEDTCLPLQSLKSG